MSKKFLVRLFVIILFVFCIAPTSVGAVTISQSHQWTTSLGYSKSPYYINGVKDSNGSLRVRYTDRIPTFLDTTNERRIFCIEPQGPFNSTSISGYTISSTIPSLRTSGHSINSSNLELLKSTLSCWYSSSYVSDNKMYGGKSYASLVAEQMLVWELVSHERTKISPSTVLNYKEGVSYKPDNIIGHSKSLYSLAISHKEVGQAYSDILKCSARFFLDNPSWSTTSTTKGSNKQELTSYNDSTQIFSRTFSHGSSLEPNLFNYYTYKINEKNADCKKGATVDGVTCSCTGAKCTFSTSKELSDPVRITFNYTYKNDGKAKLNTYPTQYYSKGDNQKLMIGSKAKSFYLNIYTGKKPKYQLKVTKKDTAGKPVSGIKFNVYSDSSAKTLIGTTTETNKDGVATYKNLTKIGTYYLKEANNKDGFITNNKIVPVNVTASNKVGTSSYSLASFTNEYMHLVMNKRTVDADGNFSDLKGDYCAVQTCPSENNRENGPIFNITKDNKKVCVSGDNGKYKLVSIAESCPAGSDNTIKTCNGKFDIEGITAGTYKVTETATACGMTLPSNPNQTVVVKANTKTTTVTMVNGASGVIFNKVSEDGALLDGGKYALQRKENGVYKDVLLKRKSGIIYEYVEGLTEGKDGATYILETVDGAINVQKLPVGEYRFVEKQAPEGYAAIKDKDSTATFTVSDKGVYGKDGKPSDYYQVSLVNQKIKLEGSYDTAELIITIITGRKVLNYALIFGGLVLVLVALIILRKKLKK